MAYKDSSGRITIDEQAAAQDIRRLQEAAQILKDSRKAIVNIINQASGEQGLTARAICEKAREMCNLIDGLINRLNETSSFISRTVAHYQEVDRQVKEAIQNSSNAWSDAVVSTPAPKAPSATDVIGNTANTVVNAAKNILGKAEDIFKSFGG